MLFLNPWLLLALAGVSIPVIIHLIRRQAAKPVEWGAMRFLLDTLSERRRRIEWEDLLLMASRCLLLALAALAVARPYVPPDAPVPWSFVLPAALLGMALFGGSFVLGTARKRLLARAAALVLFFLAAGMVLMEHRLKLHRFETSGRRDVAIILDASTSMTRQNGAKTLFDEALEEARTIVKEAPRGTSFAVILGGPAPQALSNTPVSHRADVLAQLDGLQPLGGTFRAHEAIGVATLVLAEGDRSNKEIIVLTDAQRHGWRFENAGAWKSLEEAWKALPSKPKLLLRRFPQTAGLRNAGIAAITGSRALTGTDRPAVLRVEIENTGSEPVTAGGVTLEVDGKQAGREALGLLVAGQVETAEFRHRFTTPGPHVVTARLDGRDDIPGDDRADRVVVVRQSLRVLLVDGNPAGSFFERAAGHTALALAPAAALTRGDKAGKDFLMDPEVVPAPELKPDHLAGADVVVLADVARLPAGMAVALADQVAGGGGLLVIAGPRADPGFYNAWGGPDGALMPVVLGEEATDETGISPAVATFRHESLAWAGDQRRSDLAAAAIRRWRKAKLSEENGILGAAFSNSDLFLATRGYGHGRCVAATCAFDARSGNLPARTAFVPLVHELVAWAAGGGVDWNVDAAWSPSVLLDSRTSGGLTGAYARQQNKKERPLFTRIDPVIDFNWGNGGPEKRLPGDKFTVTWTGKLMPPVDGEYLFEAEADDRITVRIAGKAVLEQAREQGQLIGRANLEAGKLVPFEVRFEEDWGEAYARLFWTPPGGSKQIVPSSACLPAEDAVVEGIEAVDPFGQTRKASVASGRRGRELRIDGVAVPGLYQVRLPQDIRESIPALGGAAELPVVVRGDIAESRLDAIREEDLAQLRSRVDTLLPGNAADVLAVLSGRGFGREITRTVAVAALVLLLLETALARWVSRSRRAGDEVKIEFGDDAPVTSAKGGWR